MARRIVAIYRRTVAGFLPAFTSCSMNARIVAGSRWQKRLTPLLAERLEDRPIVLLLSRPMCLNARSHLIHISRDGAPIGTLQVRIAMYSENRKILLVHAESPDHTPLSSDAEQSLEQFLDACNTGLIAFDPDALLPRSLRLALFARMLQTQCIDYPTWVRAGFRFHYFDRHARVTGPALIEHYRAALELHPGEKDNLYQLALRAVGQSRTLNAGTRDFSGAGRRCLLTAVVDCYTGPAFHYSPGRRVCTRRNAERDAATIMRKNQ